MGMINWIFDIYQHTKIDQVREESRATRQELARMRSEGGNLDGERLERAIGELALATKTVQRMLIEKGVCNMSDFADLLARVDREDGRADGRAPL